jgi:spore germination cell wall hydrolase CwlJ-like protein
MRAVFVIIFVFTIVFTWVVPPSVDTTQRAEFIELTPAPPIEEPEPHIDEEEITCLARNIYFESRSELLIGQYAVGDVVLNRVESKRYPNTVCEVIHQAVLSSWGLERNKIIPLRNKCQFSWYCDGKPDEITDKDAYERAYHIAYNLLHYNKYRHVTEHATHYHTHYVNPKWNQSMILVGTIGNHIFYIEE